MFYSLPIEVQLDVLKCLKFNQLFSFKQTNFYLHNLINKYENGLARMKFSRLEIGDYDLIASRKIGFTIIVPEFRKLKLDPVPDKISVPVKQPVTSEFILNRQLLKKWKTAIAESIPLYLNNFEFYREGAEFSIYLKPNYLLKLPNIPKNIEEMLIIRSGLKQLFKCAFKEGKFGEIVFNPQMINLLFDNDKTISPQFKIQHTSIILKNNTFNNFLKFTLNHLANSTDLILDMSYIPNLEQYTDILFNILTNEGNKFHWVYFYLYGSTRLCDLIIEYITTSKDCSKMVPVIFLDDNDYPNSKLKKLAKNVEKYDDFITYQIANIYNPKMRFEVNRFCRSITIGRM